VHGNALRCQELDRQILVGTRRKNAQLTAKHVELKQSYDDTLEVLGSALALKDAETEGLPAGHRVLYIHRQVHARPGPVFAHPGARRFPPRYRQDGHSRQHSSQTWPAGRRGKKMREHCEIGYNMLIRIPFLRDAAEIVLAHQEFYDGSGYPRGLKGEQIPMGARIFTIADSLDAMISDRPYRRALPMSHAREEIKRCSGSQFDPAVVDVFMTIPEQHWLDLREHLGSPFRLAHLKNL